MAYPRRCIVEIDHAKLHYHANTDEFYYVIGGKGTMVLDEDNRAAQGVVVYVREA